MVSVRMRCVQKVSSHVIWKIEVYIENDTWYKKHYTSDNDALAPFKVGTFGSHTILPIGISCPIIFSWISSMVWNLFPFKGDFSFGKSQKSQGAKSGPLGGLSESLGWFDVSLKSSVWDMMHERLCCDEAANHQVPIAVAFWIIQIVSVEEYSGLMQNLIQVHCSTRSVILNVRATQYTCSLKVSTTLTD